MTEPVFCAKTQVRVSVGHFGEGPAAEGCEGPMADQGYRLVAVRQWANQVDRVGWRLAETDDFLRLAFVQEGKIVAAEPGDRPPSLIRYPYIQTDESL